jgi:hypothetical protein
MRSIKDGGGRRPAEVVTQMLLAETVFERNVPAFLISDFIQSLRKARNRRRSRKLAYPGDKSDYRGVALTVRRTLPVFPHEQTSAGAVGMSERCQNRKWQFNSPSSLM